jgi:DHA3 family macrolide efflux protein-like MFS transporter
MDQPSAEKPKTTDRKWLRNYLPMWIGQAVSLLGSSLVQFALVWYLTDKTGSATVLAMATLVALLPQVFLGPFSGAVVDRLNRKTVMIVSDSLVALTTLGLMASFMLGSIQVWHIYLAMFLRSLFGTFQMPAMSASTTLMVPPEQYSRLSGVNQALYGVLNIISPPLGAALLAAFEINAVLMVDIVTATLAIGLLAFLVKVPQPKRADANQAITPKQVIADVRYGLKYAFTWKGLFALLIMAALANMVASPAFTLLPLHVKTHFGRGVEDVAIMESAFGIGVVIGGVLLGVWGGFKRKMATVLMGLLGMGAFFLAIGVIPAGGFMVAVFMMGLSGLMNAMANGPLGALMQAKVPPEMQGRVFTVMNSLATGAMPLGMLMAGPLANALGTSAWFVIAGVTTLITGVIAYVMKEVYTLDDQLPGGALQPAVVEAGEPAE